MALTGLLTVILTLSILAVVMLAGPTIVHIIGTLKDLILIYAGFFYFAPMSTSKEYFGCCSLILLAGICISFMGSINDIIVQVKLLAVEKQSAMAKKKSD